jgi:hypothetical protein
MMRHSRFDVVQLKRSGKSSDFYATQVLNGRPALVGGDYLTLITHTPITCTVFAHERIAQAVPELQAKPLPQKRSVEEQEAVSAPQQIDSAQCLHFERSEEELGLTARFDAVMVCYSRGEKKQCKTMGVESYARKAVFRDDGSPNFFNVIADDAEADLCILSIAPEIKALAKKMEARKQLKKGTQGLEISADDVKESYAILVKYALINMSSTDPLEMHWLSGKVSKEADYPFEVVDGNAKFLKEVSKRSDDWHNETHSDDWVVEDTGFPLWLTILLVVAFLVLLAFIVLFFLYQSTWYSPPTGRLTVIANR